MDISPAFQSQIETSLPVTPPTWDRHVARWISRLATPPLMAVLGAVLIAIQVHTTNSWWWAGFAIFTTILLPVTFVLWLVQTKRVTDFDVYLREQRTGPYLVTISCSALVCLVMTLSRAPQLFLLMAGAGLGQTLLLFLITLRWKISAHAAATAGFAVLVWQVLGQSAVLILLLIPLVGWSRVRLKRHTLGQVIAGSLLGSATFLAAFLLIAG